MAVTDCALRGWSDHYTLLCDSPFIISLVENMLGAVSDTIEEPEPRPLSRIELDVAAMVFDRISGVVRTAVAGTQSYEPVIGPAYNAEERKAADEEVETGFAAQINMAVGIGPVLSTFSLVVPQVVLLKSTIAPPRPAHIRLEDLTLGTISRLQVGDVIPFMETSDVRVDVNANGRKLYVCEFGRSGARYTVRVKDTYGSEDELLRHIVG